MSKMSNINLELQEYANDLGYSTVQDALDDGYNAVQDLVTGEWSLQRVNMAQEQKLAHEAWLKEKEELLSELYQLKDMLGLRLIEGGMPYLATINRAITFIGRVSHE